MIKDVRLNGLILHPTFVRAENINLDRYSGFRRGQLSHEESEILADFRMIAEVGLHIGAKSAQVRKVAAIDQGGSIAG